jgi:hypothetical protein
MNLSRQSAVSVVLSPDALPPLKALLVVDVQGHTLETGELFQGGNEC